MSTPPTRLTVDAVVAAALAEAAAEGLAALTMRSVAGRLGVSPMALYRHVADRDELTARTVDGAMADVVLPPHPKPGAIRAWLVAMADATRAALRRYPGTADHLLLHGPTGPHSFAFMDRVCHVLGDTGRTPEEVAQAYDWLMTTIAAYIGKEDRLDQTVGMRGAATEFAARTAAYCRRLPHVTAVQAHFTGDAEAAFARVVRDVVAALLPDG